MCPHSATEYLSAFKFGLVAADECAPASSLLGRHPVRVGELRRPASAHTLALSAAAGRASPSCFEGAPPHPPGSGLGGRSPVADRRSHSICVRDRYAPMRPVANL